MPSYVRSPFLKLHSKVSTHIIMQLHMPVVFTVRKSLHTVPTGRVVGRIKDRPSRINVTAAATRVVPNLTSLGDLRELRTDVEPQLTDLELRDVTEVSYVSRRRLDEADFDPEEVDDEGLPLVYNEQRIADFWRNRPGELATRWTKFAGISAPFLTRLFSAFIQGRLEQQQAELARDAVNNMEQLGPTFIKLGQIMSIRPDVLPPPVMVELAKLQDKITPFPTDQARAMVEQELGAPIDVIFSEFSDQPIAAASLAQVYHARLRETGQEVAVKVQRPAALSTISKDLYVMRRAVGVYEALVRRFTAQTTDYQKLLSTFAEGLYTEMDFRNEALNGQRMTELLSQAEFANPEIIIPQPIMQYTTRRVLTMEWITGVKLTTLQDDEIRSLVKVGQDAFLTQLLEIGFFHGDPHPGNLLKITEGPHAGKLALLDFGLVAEIPTRDREAMISATIHLANRDWDRLVDDFISLGFLPPDCERGKIISVMERVLGPYLRGGGAKALKSMNFQALSTDLLQTTLEIPFSVPPYMSLLARSVATLEGIALTGNPDYQMVTQAYPFVVRKVLRNDSNRSTFLLQDILYDNGSVKPTRLSALMNAALGYVAEETSGFVDFDAVPQEGASIPELLQFLLSPEARDLRPLLITEVVNGMDLLFRDRMRRSYALLVTSAPRLPFFGALPSPPVFVPGVGVMAAEEFVAAAAPPLSQQEEIYLKSITELMASVTGVSSAEIESPPLELIPRLLFNPSAEVKEIQEALAAITGTPANSQVVQQMSVEIVDRLLTLQAERLSISPASLELGKSFIRQFAAVPAASLS